MGDLMWLGGAFISILASICTNVAVNTQKFGMNKEAEKPITQQRPYIRLFTWWLGLFILLIGALLNFTSLGMAPQSVIAPLGAFTLVANLGIAHFFLKEELTKNDIAATILIIIGCLTCTGFSDHTDKVYLIDEMLSLYGKPAFIIYMVIIGLYIVLCRIALGYYNPLRNRIVMLCQDLETTDNNVEEGTIPSSKETKAEEGLEWMALSREEKITELKESRSEYDRIHGEKIHPLLFCAIAGTFSGNVLLFAKSTAQMFRVTFEGDNQMDNFFTYFFFFMMMFCIAFQTHYMTKGLGMFDALYIVPVFQVFFITLGTLGGAIYFQEFQSYGTIQLIFYPVGMLIVLIGVYLLSSRKMGAEYLYVEERDKLIPDHRRIASIARDLLSASEPSLPTRGYAITSNDIPVMFGPTVLFQRPFGTLDDELNRLAERVLHAKEQGRATIGYYAPGPSLRATRARYQFQKYRINDATEHVHDGLSSGQLSIEKGKLSLEKANPKTETKRKSRKASKIENDLRKKKSKSPPKKEFKELEIEEESKKDGDKQSGLRESGYGDDLRVSWL